jgi:hypothetical protein
MNVGYYQRTHGGDINMEGQGRKGLPLKLDCL